MNKNIEKKYPPYHGNEQYIFLCFSAADKGTIDSFLSSLYSRGCRIWYSAKKAVTTDEAAAINERIENASLAILYMSENTTDDYSAKNDILYAQKCGIPIIVFRKDSSVNLLSMGINESCPEVESEEDIIRTDGFTAGLIGEKPIKSHRFLKALVSVMLFTSLILGLFGYASRQKLITYLSSPDAITEITVGKDNYDFSAYPNLRKIIIPQSRVSEFIKYLDTYEIVLTE